MSSERPNRFIINSDYMSMAQASNYKTVVTLPTGTAVGYVGYVKREISLPTVKGAIPRYIISYETSVYNMDTQQTETKVVNVPSAGYFAIFSLSGTPTWYVTLSRKDKNTLLVEAAVRVSSSGGTFPSIAFTVNVSYIYPPNL